MMYLNYVLSVILFFVIFVYTSALLRMMNRQWIQSKWIISQYKQRESLLYVRLMGKEGKLEMVSEADEEISRGEKDSSSLFDDEVINDKAEKEIENERPFTY